MTHGTLSGYRNAGCRCGRCSRANHLYQRAYMAGQRRGPKRSAHRREWEVYRPTGELEGSIFADGRREASAELKRAFPPGCRLVLIANNALLASPPEISNA